MVTSDFELMPVTDADRIQLDVSGAELASIADDPIELLLRVGPRFCITGQIGEQAARVRTSLAELLKRKSQVKKT